MFPYCSNLSYLALKGIHLTELFIWLLCYFIYEMTQSWVFYFTYIISQRCFHIAVNVPSPGRFTLYINYILVFSLYSYIFFFLQMTSSQFMFLIFVQWKVWTLCWCWLIVIVSLAFVQFDSEILRFIYLQATVFHSVDDFYYSNVYYFLVASKGKTSE